MKGYQVSLSPCRTTAIAASPSPSGWSRSHASWGCAAHRDSRVGGVRTTSGASTGAFLRARRPARRSRDGGAPRKSRRRYSRASKPRTCISFYVKAPVEFRALGKGTLTGYLRRHSALAAGLVLEGDAGRFQLLADLIGTCVVLVALTQRARRRALRTSSSPPRRPGGTWPDRLAASRSCRLTPGAVPQARATSCGSPRRASQRSTAKAMGVSKSSFIASRKRAA